MYALAKGLGRGLRKRGVLGQRGAAPASCSAALPYTDRCPLPAPNGGRQLAPIHARPLLRLPDGPHAQPAPPPPLAGWLQL